MNLTLPIVTFYLVRLQECDIFFPKWPLLSIAESNSLRFFLIAIFFPKNSISNFFENFEYQVQSIWKRKMILSYICSVGQNQRQEYFKIADSEPAKNPVNL